MASSCAGTPCSSPGPPGTYTQLGTSGCFSLTGGWSAVDGDDVTFTLYDGAESLICLSNGSGGEFSSGTSASPFLAEVTGGSGVLVSGACWGPLLWIGVP
jgi:hypothetical protein